VADRAQVEDLLQVAPVPLDPHELLVSQGDVVGAQRRVRCPEQVLAVQVVLGPGPVGVEARSSPPRWCECTDSAPA
jgi:hypothetical protein